MHTIELKINTEYYLNIKNTIFNNNLIIYKIYCLFCLNDSVKSLLFHLHALIKQSQMDEICVINPEFNDRNKQFKCGDYFKNYDISRV